MATFRLEREVVNNSTSFDLVVVHKGGLRYIIPKSSEATYAKEQYVRIALNNFKVKEIQVDPSQALTKFDRAVLEELAAKIEELRKNVDFYQDFPTSASFVVHLGGHLADDQGAIHSEMFGFTMYSGRGNIDRAPLNVPESNLVEALAQVHRANPRNSVSYCAYVVDPKATQQPFYVNIAGRATEVPVTNDPSLPAGLYVGISIGNQPLETPFYSFDNLSKDKLEGLGVFRTKAEAMLNGNTERYQEAEAKVVSLSKVLDSKKKLLEDTTIRLEAASRKVDSLEVQVTHMKQAHLMDLARLKQEFRSAEDKRERVDHSNKEEILRLKDDSKRREARDKFAIDQMKQKSKMSFGVELLKGLAAISGLLFAGIRFFTT